ncbi:MAG: glycoside hydrolase family 43 protein [Bacteroidaceae bacterium]|nr:glycoside hydrolase family 43 protein [Bacteroidaceae bacterium]
MKKLFLSALLSASAFVANAQNPVVQTCFTTDPAPMVSGDRLYVYTGHDENDADFFWMQEWRVYSTADMVNWTDHGSPLAIEDFSWGDDRAWAPQCVERNGKFYFYVPLHSKLSGGMAIGVAVGDSPTGPFKDALGKPLYENGSWDHIDPTAFIDDDGQAYIMWGNPKVYYAKLNEDMISFASEVQTMDMTDTSVFGEMTVKDKDGKETKRGMYMEGPWFFKRDKYYYLMYAGGGMPEHILYARSKKPLTGYKFMGDVMPKCDTNSFTNHAGIAHFKGHDYFFYHTGKLPKGGGFGRSVSVEEFKWNADGTIPTIMPTDEGVKPIGTLCPFKRVEAETMAFSKGLKTEECAANGVYVTDVHNGDYIKLQAVDLGEAKYSDLVFSASSGLRGGTIEMHADSIGGTLIAELPVTNTFGWEVFRTFSAPVKQAVGGIHDMYFVFKGRKGPKLFNLDWWMLR